MEKFSLKISIFLISLFVLSTLAAPSQETPKKKHPGCWVWWFAPKCPLANIFGEDPFRIYPWKKFCKIYADFEGTQVCKEVTPTATATATVTPTTIKIQENFILASPKKLKRSAQEHGADSNVPKDQAHAHADLRALAELCASNVQFAGQHAQLCSNAAQAKIQKRSAQEHGADSNVPKDQAHAHADLRALAELCASNVQFAGQHAQLCSNADKAKIQKRSAQEHGADSNVPKDQAHAHADLQALAEMCSNNVQFAGQHAQLCSNAVQNKNQKRSTQENGSHSADLPKDQTHAHAHGRGDLRSLSELCANDANFAGQHAQLCSNAAQTAKHRRYAEASSASLDHPGCTTFFFLPDCPLSYVFGVDPLKHYPWNDLCQYRALGFKAPCFIPTQKFNTLQRTAQALSGSLSPGQLFQVAKVVGPSLTPSQLFQAAHLVGKKLDEDQLNRAAQLVGSLSPDQLYQAAQAVSKNLNVNKLYQAAQAVGINPATLFRQPAAADQAAKDTKPDARGQSVVVDSPTVSEDDFHYYDLKE